MQTLFRGGTVRRLPGKAIAEWLLVEDSKVVAVGEGEPPSADRSNPRRTVDVDGAWVLPAFRDAHVHLPVTGLYATGLDFRGRTSARAILDAFAQRAAEGNGPVFGGNFEDPLDGPLTRHELDAVAAGRPVLLARADLHSAIVSTPLLAELDVDGLEGVDRDATGEPTGYLREKAASQAWAWFDRNLSSQDQKDAVRAAVRLAYSKGIAEVHEMFVVEWRGWPAAEVFADAIADVSLDVAMWLGTTEVERVLEIGLPRIGGDLFLDGSFGSHSAWMFEPYDPLPPEGTPPRGISYRSDEELLEFFRRAHDAGLQVAVHAIGDAAIEQAIATWEKVAADPANSGARRVRAAGHRIEHFECASDDHIARAAALGLHASIQPAFDRFWGGSDGLYAARIGPARAAQMNRFSAMLEAGMMLAAGSDSTVTPMDPFLQMASLQEHHASDQRLSPLEALRLHTLGPALVAGHHRHKSALEPGMEADVAVVDRDPVAVTPEELLATEVLQTWIAGLQVWPPEAAEHR